MPYKAQINQINNQCRMIENQIWEVNNDTAEDAEKLSILVEQRSRLYSELTKLNKQQWEEDHERINFEDER